MDLDKAVNKMGWKLIAEIPSSSSKTAVVLDPESRKKYVAKLLGSKAASLEWAVSQLFRELDIGAPEVWILTQETETEALLLMDFVDNVGYFQDWINNGTCVTRQQWEDRLVIGVVDDIVGNWDRNRNNILVASEDERLVPIDHGSIDITIYGGIANSVRKAYWELDHAETVVRLTLQQMRKLDWDQEIWGRELVGRIGMVLTVLPKYLEKFQT